MGKRGVPERKPVRQRRKGTAQVEKGKQGRRHRVGVSKDKGADGGADRDEKFRGEKTGGNMGAPCTQREGKEQ